jgi:hypothetical protein
MYTAEESNPRDNSSLQPKPPPSVNSQTSIASVMSTPAIKFDSSQVLPSPSSFKPFDPTSMPPPPINAVPTPDPVLVSDADLLLNLHSPFSASSPNNPRPPLQPTSFARTSTNPPSQPDFASPTYATYPTPSDHTFGDMVIDSREVDMSLLGADMMPWDLEYLPHDMLYFGDGGFGMDEPGTGASEG